MVCKKREKTSKKTRGKHPHPHLYQLEIQDKKSRLPLLLKRRRDLANVNQSSMISQSFFAGRTAF